MSESGNSATVEVTHTVLYIEDNAVNIKLMREIFSEFLPYEFISALNAKDGIMMAKQRKPSLILMDINMSVMDGYEALAVMKDDAELKKIPVIAISGNSLPEHFEKAQLAGFVDYIPKPFNLIKLVATIKEHIS